MQTFGGTGGFMAGGRQFDGAIGNRWYEAKSGKYWETIMASKKELNRFTSSMGQRLDIAKKNGATYELFSNTPIPKTIKDWLTKKDIKFTELIRKDI